MEFAPVQIGLDIATSLAIFASAITFLINQRRKNEQSKKQSLDNSVRTVAVEKLQDALHVLSRKFIHDVVGKLNFPSNVIGAGDMPAIQQRFERRQDLPADMIGRYETASAGISSFIDEVHAYKYQVYPLLDTLENGRDEIDSFRKALDDLTNLFNEINRSAAPLAKELIATVAFCRQNPIEGMGEAEQAHLMQMAMSILKDKDYAYWVNSFIPDEHEAAYWDATHPESQDAQAQALRNFLGNAYEHPERLLAQVFLRVHMRYQEGQTICKKFLVMLAAINHTLLRNQSSGTSETPSQTAQRYASAEYFALDKEVR
jgi:hypothetical protein